MSPTGLTFTHLSELAEEINAQDVTTPAGASPTPAMSLIRGTVLGVNNSDAAYPASTVPIAISSITIGSGHLQVVTCASAHGLQSGNFIEFTDLPITIGSTGPFIVYVENSTQFTAYSLALATTPTLPGATPETTDTTAVNQIATINTSATTCTSGYVVPIQQAPYSAIVVVGSQYFFSVPWIGDEAPAPLALIVDNNFYGPFGYQVMLLSQPPSMYIIGQPSQFPFLSPNAGTASTSYGYLSQPGDGTWIPALINTGGLWSAYGGSYEVPSYKMQGNKVYLRGLAKCSQTTFSLIMGQSPLYSLPVPASEQIFHLFAGFNGTYGVIRGDIYPASSGQAGYFGLLAQPGYTAGPCNYLSFDGIVYHLD